MSFAEFDKYLNGETLHNDKKHESRTNSVGFCFGIGGRTKAKERFEQNMSGVVDTDVCCIFEVDPETMTESYGVYADPYGGFFDTVTETEYCTTQYDKTTARLLYFAVDVEDEVFYWHNPNTDDDYLTGYKLGRKEKENRIAEQKRQEEEYRREEERKNADNNKRILDAFYRLDGVDGLLHESQQVSMEYCKGWGNRYTVSFNIQPDPQLDCHIEASGFYYEDLLDGLSERIRYYEALITSPSARNRLHAICRSFIRVWGEDAKKEHVDNLLRKYNLLTWHE